MVEPQIVILVVAGSSPVDHPTSASDKAARARVGRTHRQFLCKSMHGEFQGDSFLAERWLDA
jgi:hypothetical protein